MELPDSRRSRRAHRRGDGVERRADLRAEPAGCGDDANCDQGRDEAVLDGRRTRLVLHETHDMVLHDTLPLSYWTVWRVLPVRWRLRGHAFEGAKAAENPDHYLTAG